MLPDVLQIYSLILLNLMLYTNQLLLLIVMLVVPF